MQKPIVGNRIIILGCPGSGKSTLAESLHMRTGLPLFHLDNIWWKADRTHITREEFDHRLHTILMGDQWIIDGDYSRTYEPRFQSCDTVLFLDYEEKECIAGIIERVGKARTDIPWTEQRLDPELVHLVRCYHMDKRQKLYRLIEKYSDKRVLIFKTRAQAQEWISGI